jgi:competence ComEA-like helix-hairpin-helix protein
MKNWHLVTLGVFIGLILAGVAYMLAGIKQTPEFSYISPTYSTTSAIDPESIKLDINTASLEELDKLPGIGPEKAQAIIDFRDNNGKFVSIEDLLYVPGIGRSLFEQISDKITVQ